MISLREFQLGSSEAQSFLTCHAFLLYHKSMISSEKKSSSGTFVS